VVFNLLNKELKVFLVYENAKNEMSLVAGIVAGDLK
jgi:hypothetical protein